MKKFLGFSIVLCGLYSCKTSYIPNHVNTPLFQQKGEARVNVNPGNIQAAYAVTDHFGVMLNGFGKTADYNIRDSGSTEDTYNKAKGSLIEAGIGYYSKLDESGWVAEIYAGVGTGKLSFEDKVRQGGTYQIRTYNANGAKVFIQPAVGFTSDYFDAAFAVRVTSLKFNNATWSSNYPERDLREDKLYDLDKPNWTFVEPTLTLRAGYKFIKAYLQMGYSYKLNPEEMNNKGGIFGAGLTFTYSPRFLNK